MSTVLDRDPVRVFLESAAEAKLDMHRLEYQCQTALEECQRITAQLGQTPGGSGDMHKDRAWAAYADLRKSLEDAYVRAAEKEKAVQSFIALLPRAVHRAILCLRYLQVDGKERVKPAKRQKKPLLPWPAVQEKLRDMGIWYEERQIHNLHGDALDEARRIWAELQMEDTDK